MKYTKHNKADISTVPSSVVHYCIFGIFTTRFYEEMLTQLREEIQSCAKLGLSDNLNREGVSIADIH